MHSGIATGLVFWGAPPQPPLSSLQSSSDASARWLTDKGLLALCPRLSSSDFWEHFDDTDSDEHTGCETDGSQGWETLDVDFDLTLRMKGYFT